MAVSLEAFQYKISLQPLPWDEIDALSELHDHILKASSVNTQYCFYCPKN